MIELKGDGFKVIPHPEAEKLKLSLLKNSASVKVVDDKPSEAIALSTASELASFRKQLETTRKAVKQPVLDLGKRIDAVAEKFGQEVEVEEKRIRTHLGSYQMKLAQEQQKIMEAVRVKQQEAARILREAEEAQKQKSLAEAEALRLSQLKKSQPLAEVKAERLAEKLEAKAEALEQQALDARVAAMQMEQIADDTKVKGGGMTWDYEVTDIQALYAECPELVKLEDKRRDILDRLKTLEDSGKPTGIHGLRTFKVPSIRIR